MVKSLKNTCYGGHFLKIRSAKKLWKTSHRCFTKIEPTIIHKIFETNSSFHVKLHYGKSLISVFQKIFTSIDKIFISSGGLNTGKKIIWRFQILLLFPNFLRSYVLSRPAVREATRTYQFITNNHTSFNLRWKENLLKHQKVSKYYEHDCRL